MLKSERSEPAITALWEQVLDDIAHGRQTRDAFLQRQEAWIKQFVDDALSSSDSASAFSHVTNRRLPAPT
jgi:DNA topoisomerase IA